MTTFAWLIEAPGPRYLAVRSLQSGMMCDFVWSSDHNQAIALSTQHQADALMMAIRQMDRDHCGGALFAFEAVLSNARAVEHGWMAPRALAAQGDAAK